MKHKEQSNLIPSVKLLLEQSRAQIYKDSTLGLELANQALDLLLSQAVYNEPAVEAEILLTSGTHSLELANFPDAHTNLNRALLLFEQLSDLDSQIRTLHMLNVTHFRLGEAEDSLSYTLQILDLLGKVVFSTNVKKVSTFYIIFELLKHVILVIYSLPEE